LLCNISVTTPLRFRVILIYAFMDQQLPIKDQRAKNSMFYALCFILLSLIPATVSARLELSVLRPVAQRFITNNSELIVEGLVKVERVDFIAYRQVFVSVNTPAGVSDLGAIELPLRSLMVELGTEKKPLTALVLSPVFEGEFSLGPRIVRLSFSDDGEVFEDGGTFNCPSGMGQEYGEAWVDFDVVAEARFVQIDMLDGWQTDRIAVREVEFLDATGELLGVRIRGISISLDLDEDGQAYFQMAIPLREGENRISIKGETEQEESVQAITVTYMPEVVVEEEPLILTDGYKAELTIPPTPLRSEIRKIGIHPLDVNEIAWASYSDNVRVVRGTSPVLAYEVQVSAATPFLATAKGSLERQPPGLAVDGNPEYPSTWITTLTPLPVWLKIDLREPRSIGEVIIISRVAKEISYGPARLKVLTSDDDVNYDEAARCDQCNDASFLEKSLQAFSKGLDRTEVALPATPTARYVQIVIEEGKQGNNIQINEVELYDPEGAKVVSYSRLSSAILARPAELTLLYEDSDLIAAGVQTEENLAIFTWNEGMQEWEMAGGKVDLANNSVTVTLNYLSRVALFEAVPSASEIHWSYNPFSPNGDGIADTTIISINLGGEGQAKVEIFDYMGKLVRTLVHEDARSGHISILWDGKDENGDPVSIGPYIYQVIIGKEIRNGVLIVAR